MSPEWTPSPKTKNPLPPCGDIGFLFGAGYQIELGDPRLTAFARSTFGLRVQNPPPAAFVELARLRLRHFSLLVPASKNKKSAATLR